MDNINSAFVEIANAVPDVILEIRYYSTFNFIGDRIDGYIEPTALLTKEAAKALKTARKSSLNSASLQSIQATAEEARLISPSLICHADVMSIWEDTLITLGI